MLKLGWFSPISVSTGIARYTQTILEEISQSFPRNELDVNVFHPTAQGQTVSLPYPRIELSDELIRSDINALYDIAIYHVGNNSLHHQQIFDTMSHHPGVVVLHDHVYQHYFAGIHHRNQGVSQGYGALVQDACGSDGFSVLNSAGILPVDNGNVRFTPWETDWATVAPLSNVLTQMAYGIVVHSEYTRQTIDAPAAKIFMPTNFSTTVKPVLASDQKRIRLTCAGHIQPTKGLKLLVSAFAVSPSLRDRYKVVIVGHPSDQSFLSSLQREIVLMSLDNTFEFILSPAEELYRTTIDDTDLHYNLRFPNTEGASLSLSEQLATGRPVIAYRTGSFAEIPDDACYFLDQVGDTNELVRMLTHIAANPQEIAKRGAKAKDFSRGQSVASYVKILIDYLKHNQETFASRAASINTRKAMSKENFGNIDSSWLEECASARTLYKAVQRGCFALPRNLFSCTPEALGRFILTNQMRVRADKKILTHVGETVLAMPRERAIELIGILSLLGMSDKSEWPLKGKFIDIALPIIDTATWTILLQLEPKYAITTALRAVTGSSNQDDIDALLRMAEELGVGATLAAHFEKLPHWEQQYFAPIRQLIEKQKVTSLYQKTAYPPGTNIIEMLRSSEGNSNFLITGFNSPEPGGIWSKQEWATIYLHSKEPLERLTIRYDLVDVQTTGAVLAAVRLTELESGVTTLLSNNTPEKDLAANQFEREIPQMNGLIQLELNTSSIVNLSERGVSADSRDLGIMLKTLVLDTKIDAAS